jgi:hypothetical protein
LTEFQRAFYIGLDLRNLKNGKMITTDEILTNAFFAFFYSLGWVVDLIWAGAFVAFLVLLLTRLFDKQISKE